MPHLIIVGAGPAGATLAYLLARRDIEVTLVERQTDFAREFRGEGLQPSGIDAFGQMGLGDAFDALPHCLFDAIQFHRYTRPLFRLDLAGGGPRWVSQPAMLEMLVEHAGTCPSFTLVRGARVHDLIRRDDRVAGVRCAVGDDEREVVGDYVVVTRRPRLDGPEAGVSGPRTHPSELRRRLVQDAVAGADPGARNGAGVSGQRALHDCVSILR